MLFFIKTIYFCWGSTVSSVIQYISDNKVWIKQRNNQYLRLFQNATRPCWPIKTELYPNKKQKHFEPPLPSNWSLSHSSNHPTTRHSTTKHLNQVMGHQIHFNLVLGYQWLVSPNYRFNVYNWTSSVYWRWPICKITQETEICVLLSANYKQDAEILFFGLRKRQKNPD